MSSISGVSSLWDTTAATATTATGSTQNAFSQAVSQLSGSGSGSGGSSSGSDEEQVTIQRTLPDGSILVQVMQGNEIVSQTKISVAQQKAMLMPGTMQGSAGGAAIQTTAADHFNDTSTSMLAGSLFDAGI